MLLSFAWEKKGSGFDGGSGKSGVDGTGEGQNVDVPAKSTVGRLAIDAAGVYCCSTPYFTSIDA